MALARVSNGDLLLIAAPDLSGKLVLAIADVDPQTKKVIATWGDIFYPCLLNKHTCPLHVELEVLDRSAGVLVGTLYDTVEACISAITPYIARPHRYGK
jgi:hypothetical protein